MSVESLLSQMGIRYRIIDDEAVARCPYHQDSHPSWSVNIRNGLHYCLSGETKVLTWDGYKEIKFLAGTTQKIVTVDGHKVNWVEAPFKSYGNQRLYELKLSRNGVSKSIFATAEHRWFAKTSGSGPYLERTTVDLKPGYRLQSAKIPGSGNINVNPWAVAHGFTFGDGHLVKDGRLGSAVTLWGEKDKALEDFFPLNVRYQVATANGIAGQNITGLPKFFKSYPSIDESASYLYGWLAGYFAADGCVTETGYPQMHSANLDNILFVRNVCIRLGITTYNIGNRLRKGFGEEDSALYSIAFSRSQLSEDFFIIDEHRKRWLEHNKVQERPGWVVVSVEETDRFEEVYCAEVPETHNFMLEDNIVTGNCFSCGARGTIAGLIHDFLGYSYAESVIMANEVVGHARMDKWREDIESRDNVHLSPMAMKVTDADMALFTEPPETQLTSKNITLAAANYYNIQWNTQHESWIFPYRDPFSDELWGWQEKNDRIFRNFPAGTKKSKTLFGYSKVSSKGTVVLVESPIDCAVLYSAGYLNAVSSFGIPNGTYQLSLLQYKRTHTLILGLDNDKAGLDATTELIREAMNMFRLVKVFNYFKTEAKDPGEMNQLEIERGMELAIPALRWLHRDF